MIIESLNIGLPKKETFPGGEVVTGICKRPTSQPLFLGKMGFEGDGVADLKHHGGEDKAVCVYSKDHYPYWEELLGIPLIPAAFGENLTVNNLLEDSVSIGDIFQLGTALVQVSQPRQPCKTLAARYGKDDMVKLVRDSGRTGFYLRVLEKGVVERTNRIILQDRDPHGITVSFANRIFYYDRNNCEAIEKVLEVPALSRSWKRSFQELREQC